MLITLTFRNGRYEKKEMVFLQATFRLDLWNRCEGHKLNIDHINQVLCKAIKEVESYHLNVTSK